jgi:hypothetical protein
VNTGRRSVNSAHTPERTVPNDPASAPELTKTMSPQRFSPPDRRCAGHGIPIAKLHAAESLLEGAIRDLESE